jgi:Gnt-I system high-affinity gluconate transporter
MPSLGVSIFTALLPVILLAGAAIVKIFISEDSIIMPIVNFIGDPVIAMIITILIAIYTLGIARGKNMNQVSESLLSAVKDIAMILLIIAGAGALKEILIVSQVSNYIGELLQGVKVSPLILAWGIAAIIRFCVGSATVAGLTAAGIVVPLIALTGANPNLMVLATGAGSLMFSHVNDTGFWLFKEYFNMSVKDTLKTWSVMEMIVSVTGLIGVLIINQFI